MPLRLAMLGMWHTHADGIVRQIAEHPKEFTLVGFYDREPEVVKRRIKQWEPRIGKAVLDLPGMFHAFSADGKLVAAGFSNDSLGQTTFTVARYSLDGSLLAPGGFAPASRITLPRSSCSLRMKASNSAGELPTGVAPIFSSAVSTTGSFMAVARSALILATRSGAMPAGPKNPHQTEAS